jgi:hypothetical protein
MKKVVFLWMVLGLASTGGSQERGAAPYASMQPSKNGKPRTRLLPIGDALTFASIGTGLVWWLRKRHTL